MGRADTSHFAPHAEREAMENMNRYLTISVLVLLVGLTGCATPQVSVRCMRTDTGEIQFTLHKNSKVGGFGDMRIWTEGGEQYLWFVSVGYHPTNTLVFGEVPYYPYPRSPQKFPTPPAKPVQPKPDDVFYVGLGFQYDSAWPPSACAADALFKFRITPQGDVEELGTVWHPWQMERYTERVKEPTQAWPQQPDQAYKKQLRHFVKVI